MVAPFWLVYRARHIVERLALVFQAALLARFGAPSVFHAFVKTRIQGVGGRAFGTLPRGIDISSILERLAW